MKKLEIIKKTREIASETLHETLREVLGSDKNISEYDFTELWLSKLRTHKEIFPDGWYIPPPHGIGVLFATSKDHKRVEFKSLRKKEYWPKKNVFLDRKDGFALFYCSPVDKKTFIIGDYGLSIYLGNDKKIQKALENYLLLLKQIFEQVNFGISLSDVQKIARDLHMENGFTNEWWISFTDTTGTNYGHTIPSTESPWSKDEVEILTNGDWNSKSNTISKKRKFLNAFEKKILTSGLAFTIESRAKQIDNKNIPTLYFHTIALFEEGGRKEQLIGFDKIFKLVGMDYMTK